MEEKLVLLSPYFYMAVTVSFWWSLCSFLPRCFDAFTSPFCPCKHLSLCVVLSLQYFVLFCSEWKSEVTQSCLSLCNPMDYSLPGSSLHGILQARVLEWVAISSSRGSSQPRDQTRVSLIPGRCFNLWATREAPNSPHILCESHCCATLNRMRNGSVSSVLHKSVFVGPEIWLLVNCWNFLISILRS